MLMDFLASLSLWAFISIVALFFLIESVCLYSRAYVFNYLLLVPFAIICYTFFNANDFNLFYLSFYPVLAVGWLAAYWYMTMHRTALEISNGVSQAGSIEKFYNSLSYGDSLREHFDRHAVNGNIKVDIQHPPFKELFINGLFFLPSMLVFFCDNLFRYVYNSLLAFMERVRKSFSDSINVRFAPQGKDSGEAS